MLVIIFIDDNSTPSVFLFKSCCSLSTDSPIYLLVLKLAVGKVVDQ